MLDKKTAVSREPTIETLPTRGKRADRAAEIRRKLIDSAAKVVGAEGYANASVAKITALAEIAQGTFYNYFASQQELFDHLLPELGGELLDLIREQTAGESDSFKRDEIGFRTFFDFLARRPEFYRILNEAETFAPKAYHDHMRNMAQGYMRALARSHAKGELQGYELRELEVIVYALLAVRNYISYRYLYRDIGGARRLPPWVAETYAKLVAGGLKGGHSSRPPRSRRREEGASESSSHAPVPVAAIKPDGADAWHISVSHTRNVDQPVHSTLLQVIDDAARSVAATFSELARLQSLSVSFPQPATSAPIEGLARAVASGSAVHVSITLSQPPTVGPVATGQALFSIEAEDRRTTQ